MNEVDLTKGTPTSDFQTVLSVFPLDRLDRLRTSLRDEKVIRNHYVDSDGKGCLMYWLSNVESKCDLLAYDFGADGAETLMAARRTIRRWDNGSLTQPTVTRILNLAIKTRREVNEQEDRAIASAVRQMSTQPACR